QSRRMFSPIRALVCRRDRLELGIDLTSVGAGLRLTGNILLGSSWGHDSLPTIGLLVVEGWFDHSTLDCSVPDDHLDGLPHLRIGRVDVGQRYPLLYYRRECSTGNIAYLLPGCVANIEPMTRNPIV